MEKADLGIFRKNIVPLVITAREYMRILEPVIAREVLATLQEIQKLLCDVPDLEKDELAKMDLSKAIDVLFYKTPPLSDFLPTIALGRFEIDEETSKEQLRKQLADKETPLKISSEIHAKIIMLYQEMQILRNWCVSVF